jgi:MoxR-like ATPase
VTHNEEKPLPPAFLRRCIYHELKFPEDDAFLVDVLAAHEIGDAVLGARAVEVLLRLRTLELTRQPGISELLDWARVLQARGVDPKRLDSIPAIDALVKSRLDQELARRKVAPTPVQTAASTP